jgi:outer membrane lipoprotein-sorting protein
MRRSSLLGILTLFPLVLATSGCVFRTRPVEETYSKAPLVQSSQQGLIDAIDKQADTIRSLQATVDIDTSAGGAKKGHVTDYKEIRGYVLARKPSMLRMIGLMPIVRTTAFDMVSNGQDFRLSIPPKNRFVVGSNAVGSPNADQPMENIRPQDIYDALLIRRVDPKSEIAVLENGYEILHDSKGHRVLQEDYELVVIRKSGNDWKISRRIVFSRTDLHPARQYIYDDQGDLTTDARYADYKDYDGVGYPSRIEIARPAEEYDIKMNVLKLEINKPLKDEQFVLEQPPGAVMVDLNRPQSSSSAPATPPGR